MHGLEREAEGNGRAHGVATPTARSAATTRTLSAERFATLLGVRPEALPAACREIIHAADFEHEVLVGSARDAIVLGVLRALEGDLSVAGPARIEAWENGWGDVLARFEASGCRPEELWPHYLRPERRIVRLEGEYVLPTVGTFEADFVRVMQAWFSETFLGDVASVYEFGCGPGHNLVAFAQRRPERSCTGLDWATASQRVLAKVSGALGLDIAGRQFDMLHPDTSFRLVPGAGVVTFGALEQLGTSFGPFLKYLRAANPAVCVHLEPVHELYDPASLFDFMAARYAERRGYLRGYLTELRALEQRGQVEILHVKKHLGSLYHDGWVSLAWRPTRER